MKSTRVRSVRRGFFKGRREEHGAVEKQYEKLPIGFKYSGVIVTAEEELKQKYNREILKGVKYWSDKMPLECT